MKRKRQVKRCGTAIPSDERWLHDRPAALEKVKRGLAQAARGEVRSLGSFAKYVKAK